MPSQGTVRQVAHFGGFLVGGIVGGAVMWVVGLAAFGSGETPTGILSFFLAITSLVFAVVSPFVVAAFVRSRVSGKARRQLVTIGGFVLSFLFFLALGVVGVVFLGDLGIDSPIEGIAFLDAVAGFVYGGILGWEAAEWAVERSRRAGEPDPWS